MRLVGYDIRAGLRRDELMAALDDVDAACRPLDTAAVLKELNRLQANTIPRNGDDANAWEMRLEVWCEQLAAYPADIVTYVLRTSHTNNWFPSWHAVEERLEALSRKRFALREVLTAALG